MFGSPPKWAPEADTATPPLPDPRWTSWCTRRTPLASRASSSSSVGRPSPPGSGCAPALGGVKGGEGSPPGNPLRRTYQTVHWNSKAEMKKSRGKVANDCQSLCNRLREFSCLLDLPPSPASPTCPPPLIAGGGEGPGDAVPRAPPRGGHPPLPPGPRRRPPPAARAPLAPQLPPF